MRVLCFYPAIAVDHFSRPCPPALLRRQRLAKVLGIDPASAQNEVEFQKAVAEWPSRNDHADDKIVRQAETHASALPTTTTTSGESEAARAAVETGPTDENFAKGGTPLPVLDPTARTHLNVHSWNPVTPFSASSEAMGLV